MRPLADRGAQRLRKMARYLYVVSRRDVTLFSYLKDRFADDANVVVVLDRRYGERRQRSEPPSVERRERDRRMHPEVDVELQMNSHVIITLP
jgi:hypothetical protein